MILLKDKILQDCLYDEMVTLRQDIGGGQPLKCIQGRREDLKIKIKTVQTLDLQEIQIFKFRGILVICNLVCCQNCYILVRFPFPYLTLHFCLGDLVTTLGHFSGS